MTDQNVPNVTDEERMLARKWAEFIESGSATWTDRIYAAARVILNTVPAPAPSRPTLADMTDEERAACQWMQADVVNRRVRYVIANPLDEDDEIALIDHDGDICWLSPGLVTPRPDLPRLEWPGDQKPAPAPTLPVGWRIADHKNNGRVIVTNTPDRYGRVYYVLPSADDLGFDWLFCDDSELTYLDTEP